MFGAISPPVETARPLIIALDGRSGAGKTSLAAALAEAWGEEQVAVLHLEDLYRGWQSLTDTCRRYADLLQHICAGQEVSWPRWDWDRQAVGEQLGRFSPRQIVIIEGVGALSSAARSHVDLGIWLDAEDGSRRDRALGRDGELFARHWQVWADEELAYLRDEDPRATAHLLLTADSPGQEPILQQLRRLLRFLPRELRSRLPHAWGRAPAPAQEQMPAPTDPASLFEALAEHCPRAALLESTSHRLEDPLNRNRYTVLALAQQSNAAHLVSHAGGTEVRADGATLRLGNSFFEALAGIWPDPEAASDTIKSPGAPDPQWVGYLGYELKREVGANEVAARLPDGSVRPDAQFFEPDTVLVIDHVEATLTVRALPELLPATLGRIRELLHEIRSAAPMTPVQFQCRDSEAGYRLKVRAAQAEIREGNSYEICLTTELHALAEQFSPFEAYCRLRKSSPAPFAHYLRFGPLEVASISPERFMSISADGRLRAEPIKGTRPRGRDAAADAALRRDLATHPKDHAENIMIVDLLRNDLSRHAVPGSLSVPRLCAVETYATVHQMVSTIDARLLEPALAAKALQAAFPPGSMTGAPKLSTMDILDRLEEDRARGLYSGAVGYLGADGGADLAVVIRTLVCDQLSDGRWSLTLGLGGAVTADSDPQAEWDEVRTKSLGVLSALDSKFPEELAHAALKPAHP